MRDLHNMNSNLTNTAALAAGQYATPDNLRARRELFNYSVPRFDIPGIALDCLKLNRDETIVDIGCHDGQTLVRLRRERGHTGRLVGVDINAALFPDTKDQDIQPPIEFVVASGDSLPLPDESVDIIWAFFVLYHLPDIQKSLSGWRRVLKPGGKVVVSTSSPAHKPKHQYFKQKMGALTGSAPPEQFSRRFNLENGRELLQSAFPVIGQAEFTAEIRLRDPNPYLAALDSIRDMYEPVPSLTEWAKARTVIAEEVNAIIARDGHFIEPTKSGFFVSRKT